MNFLLKFAFLLAVLVLHVGQAGVFWWLGDRPGALILTGYTIADIFLILALAANTP